MLLARKRRDPRRGP